MRPGIVRSLALALGVVALARCSADGPTSVLGVEVPGAVGRFLEDQHPGTLIGFAPVLDQPRSELLLFRVQYGPPLDCAPECTYATAYGLALGDRVGWLAAPAGHDAAIFDILPADTTLFAPELLARLGTLEAGAYDAFRLRLASDPDTPLSALVAVAGSLREPSGPAGTGEALLANSLAARDFDVLSELALMDVFLAPSAWRDVRDSAWARLGPLVPPVATLAFTASVRLSDGILFAGATVTNGSAGTTILAYGPFCAPILRLFRDSSRTGSPVWDAERWWWTWHFGGCKLPPYVSSVSAGQARGLGGPGFEPGDVLGDSLAAGRYWAAVPVRVSTPAGDTSLLVPAGVLELSAERSAGHAARAAP